jgi:hypothetical protein
MLVCCFIFSFSFRGLFCFLSFVRTLASLVWRDGHYSGIGGALGIAWLNVCPGS